MKRDQGTARAISTFIDPSLAWEDLKWFRSITSTPHSLSQYYAQRGAIVEHSVCTTLHFS